ncbi:MAG: hypothetical protein OXF24_08805 [Hyphomicrobiales bacterium]|nr:hypothetical protein [Hyphomicrobiales bacterium]MCY4049673.1 hypothetical protein [Hyphomicrobiales bacterium]
MEEPARCETADSSFLVRLERGRVPTSEGLVHRVAAGPSIDAGSSLVQADHLPEDARLLPVEHPQRVPDILQSAFRHHDEPVKLGQ